MDFPDFMLHPKLITGLCKATHALSGVHTALWRSWVEALPTAARTLRVVNGMHPDLTETVYLWRFRACLGMVRHSSDSATRAAELVACANIYALLKN